MASRQAVEAENIEAAARLGVDRLRDVTRDREQDQGTHPETQSRDQQEQQKGSGFLGSVLKSAGEMYEEVKGSITESTAGVGDISGTRDVDNVPGKENGTKDSAMDDAVEHTSDKAKQENDGVSGRMSEMMENAAIAARRTVDHINWQEGGDQ